MDELQLRRSDLDDAREIETFVEVGKRATYMRVYSSIEILHLIETSFLSITVLTGDGKIMAFAAFDHSPLVRLPMTAQGIKGQTDKKHYNKWEDWLPVAFDASDFSPFNTLWLSFFVCAEAIGPELHNEVLKRVMQSVYTSLSELNGILFLLRKTGRKSE